MIVLHVKTTWEKKSRGRAHKRCVGCAEVRLDDELVWFRGDTEVWICDLCLRDVVGVPEAEAVAG